MSKAKKKLLGIFIIVQTREFVIWAIRLEVYEKYHTVFIYYFCNRKGCRAIWWYVVLQFFGKEG